MSKIFYQKYMKKVKGSNSKIFDIKAIKICFNHPLDWFYFWVILFDDWMITLENAEKGILNNEVLPCHVLYFIDTGKVNNNLIKIMVKTQNNIYKIVYCNFFRSIYAPSTRRMEDRYKKKRKSIPAYVTMKNCHRDYLKLSKIF